MPKTKNSTIIETNKTKGNFCNSRWGCAATLLNDTETTSQNEVTRNVKYRKNKKKKQKKNTIVINITRMMVGKQQVKR